MINSFMYAKNQAVENRVLNQEYTIAFFSKEREKAQEIQQKILESVNSTNPYPISDTRADEAAARSRSL